MTFDALTVFGLFAVSAMLISYAFESRSHWCGDSEIRQIRWKVRSEFPNLQPHQQIYESSVLIWI
jgi:hypothetical protein